MRGSSSPGPLHGEKTGKQRLPTPFEVRQYRAGEVWQALLIAIDAAVALGELVKALCLVGFAIPLFPDDHPLKEILERQRRDIRHALAVQERQRRQRKLMSQIPLAAVERAMTAGILR